MKALSYCSRAMPAAMLSPTMIMESKPLKLEASNKLSLLSVALVMVSYHSNRKVTKPSPMTFPAHNLMQYQSYALQAGVTSAEAC